MPLRSDQTHWSTREDKAVATCSARAMTSQDTADYLNRTFHDGETIRTEAAVSIRRGKLKLKVAKRVKSAPKTPAPDEETQQTINREESGDEIVLRSFGSEVTTIDELVARAKIDLTKYEVDKPETSMHETTVRTVDGKIRKVQNFRIVARFRLKAGPSTQEIVRDMIHEMRGTFAILKYPKHEGDAEILQTIDIFDPHIGKLAYPAETGDKPWDTPISIDTLRDGALHLMREGDARGVGERAFCIGGDYFQHDGRGMTTKGTVIDYDTRFSKMYRGGTRLLIDLIATSAAKMPTRVYIVPGNHDATLSFALQESLVIKFEHDKRVMVDERFTSTKFFSWGRCLLGLDHGDKGKKRLPHAMATLCEAEWGNSIVREIHTGHLHSKAMIETMGNVVVRTMDSLAPADKFHAEEKFNTAPRTIEAFRYHKGGMLAGTDSWSPDLNRAPRKGT